LYVAAQRNERRRITAMGPWQKASVQRGAEGILARKETEAEKKTEEENHLASQRQRRESQSQARKERQREKRRGGREIFLLWRLGEAESGLTD
jgi:hypothetical protein